jgi:pilus assembly protein CpaE
MSRTALVIADAIDQETATTATLARFGVEEIISSVELTAALELLSHRHIDLVFVSVDSLTEPMLAQLDRAIRRERHTDVIGTGAKPDPDVMLRAMRAGIQEFLVRPVNQADLSAALERQMRRAKGAGTSGMVIACYCAKGGLGVSSIAANLASGLASLHRSKRVAVVDLVIPNGEQRLHFNASVAYDVGEVATKPDRLDQELLNSVLAPVRDGIWMLASSEDPEVDEMVDAAMANAVLQQLRTSFHYTVVDCDHQLNDRTLAVLDAADRILLVTQLNVSALRSTQRSLGIFRRLGYPNEKLCVVVNRLQSGEVISVSDAVDALKSDVYFKLPNDYKVMAEGVSRGASAREVDAQSKVAIAFTALATKLSGADASALRSKNGAPPRSRLRGLFTRKK